MRLAVRPQTTGLTAAEVTLAVVAERSLVISWLNRVPSIWLGRRTTDGFSVSMPHLERPR